MSLLQKNKDIILVLLTTLTVSLVIPLHLMGVAPAEYSFVDSKSFLAAAFLLLLFFIAIQILFYFLFRRIGKASYALFVMCLFFSWIFLSGLFIPIIESSSMVDFENISVNKVQ